MENKEIAKLAYDMTYQRYIMNKDKASHLFKDITVADYVVLHSILGIDSKAYLEKIAEHLELSIPKMSKLATELKNKGLIIWSHDGDGSEGTYLQVTETGINLLNKQEEKLRSYYEKVIRRFGLKNTVDLLGKLAALEKIMDEEFTDE